MNRTAALAHRARLAALATITIAAGAIGGCYSSTAADRAPFSEVSAEPSAVKMPKMSSPDLPNQSVPTEKQQQKSDDPCATDDTTIAACLDGTTALVGFGPNQALVATEAGDVFLVAPGKKPEHVVNTGAPVTQFLASPSVTEDGQVYILRSDDTIARLTVITMGGLQADIKEMPELTEPGIEGIFFAGRRQVNKLISGDVNIVFHQLCHTPPDLPQLMTVSVEGIPQLAGFDDGIIDPLGGVDLDDSIGGCAVGGGKVAVAIPDAQKVVLVDIRGHGGPDAGWEITGSPDTIIDGEFGHISHVAVVEGIQGFEIWAATTNRAAGEGGASDERVIRLPQGGAAGGSPD